MKCICFCTHLHENAKKRKKNENAKKSIKTKTHVFKNEDEYFQERRRKKKTKTKTQILGERCQLSSGEYCIMQSDTEACYCMKGKSTKFGQAEWNKMRPFCYWPLPSIKGLLNFTFNESHWISSKHWLWE